MKTNLSGKKISTFKYVQLSTRKRKRTKSGSLFLMFPTLSPLWLFFFIMIIIIYKYIRCLFFDVGGFQSCQICIALLNVLIIIVLCERGRPLPSLSLSFSPPSLFCAPSEESSNHRPSPLLCRFLFSPPHDVSKRETAASRWFGFQCECCLYLFFSRTR